MCESMKHVAMHSCKESWKVEPCAQLKLLIRAEDREKRYWGEGVSAIWINKKENQGVFVCHYISSTKEGSFCVFSCRYWFSKWNCPFRREELTV